MQRWILHPETEFAHRGGCWDCSFFFSSSCRPEYETASTESNPSPSACCYAEKNELPAQHITVKPDTASKVDSHLDTCGSPRTHAQCWHSCSPCLIALLPFPSREPSLHHQRLFALCYWCGTSRGEQQIARFEDHPGRPS